MYIEFKYIFLKVMAQIFKERKVKTEENVFICC